MNSRGDVHFMCAFQSGPGLRHGGNSRKMNDRIEVRGPVVWKISKNVTFLKIQFRVIRKIRLHARAQIINYRNSTACGEQRFADV